MPTTQKRILMLKKIFAPIVWILDFITKYFKTFVFLFIVALIAVSISEPIQTPNLAKIQIKGMILDSAPLRAQIENLKKYPSIKGVLLVIDSPGGALGASVEMADMIRDLNAHIPVVAHAEGVMASGSYYAGVYASKVYANRGSLVGSIGVIFSGFNIEELLDKIGYKSRVIKAGQYKEAGAYYREWTPQEHAYLQNLINEEYQMFVSDIAKERKLDINNADAFAQGKIFNASRAQKIGLIDEVGSRDEAIAKLKALSGVTQEVWLQKTKFEDYFDGMLESSMSLILGKFHLDLR